MKGFACKSLKDGEVLGTIEYVTVVVNITDGVVGGLNGGIGGCLTHIVPRTVHRIGSGLANQLGSSVAIEIIEQKLSVMGASTDVLP